MQQNWLKQTKEKPLFPDILWSRPENRRQAGKLMIIGGNLNSFNSISQAFQAAQDAGVGSIRALVPDSLRKTLANALPEATFCPRTPSGSFARTSLDEFMATAEWADCVMLAGDFGKNSETAILLETFIGKYHGQLVITGDSLDYFFKNYQLLLNRPKTFVAADLSGLQKVLAGKVFFKHSVELAQLVELLSEASNGTSMIPATLLNGQAVVAAGGRVSSTPTKLSLTEIAARAAVFWLQTPSKPFEAITSSVL